MFQSTHPGWGATRSRYNLKSFKIMFQSTHPGWGATSLMFATCDNIMFQSTHPGWGATISELYDDSKYRVSIHAPRVGCDGFYWMALNSMIVSIHAPRVGCDDISALSDGKTTCFNPRTPGGVRRTYRQESMKRRWSFNPRTPGGVRLPNCVISLHITLFQSTHPGWGATAG